MAKVIPFRGVIYNPDKIESIADVVAPPYDVISSDGQRELFERHTNNVIRLILGYIYPEDDEKQNRYTRACHDFETWCQKGVLSTDSSPALYLTTQEYTAYGTSLKRYGVIARVKLEPFDKGIVLPHERTFSKVKSERLKLMKACQTNFSPIFSLYSDNDNILENLKNATGENTPDIDITDYSGHGHKLWRITDPDVHQKFTAAMQDKTIYIADGHHRYGTALNYRNWLAENTENFSDDHPANYVMMYLSSLEDSGLTIYPAHRILAQVPESEREELIRKAATYFEIEKNEFTEETRESSQQVFFDKLSGKDDGSTIGVYMKNRSCFYLMTLKQGIMEREFAAEIPEPLQDLDVNVLTQLIMIKLLGFDQARLDNENLIAYSSLKEKAIEMVQSGGYDIAFILNPTKIEQVQRVAQAGLTMPRKSTYFYPKVITGLVINDLKPQS